MKNINSISPATKLCGIIGNPVEHSMSPALHNSAFSELNLDYVYLAFKVLPGTVSKALDGVRALDNFRGLSVTIPHKIEVMECVDIVSDVDRAIGSINTIVNNDGVLTGLGSDGPGARKALVENNINPADKNVVIIGTGGASRAIAFDLAFNAPPKKLTLLGVEKDQLIELVDDIAQKSDTVVEGKLIDDSIESSIKKSQVLINASPVGMHPKIENSPIAKELLHDELSVMDIVYNPLTTKLLNDAKNNGLITVSGVDMFVNQAVIQFESWTGKDAPVALMRETVLQKLGHK